MTEASASLMAWVRDFAEWYETAQQETAAAKELEIQDSFGGVRPFHKYFYRLPPLGRNLSPREDRAALGLLADIFDAWTEQLWSLSSPHYVFLSLNEERVLNSSVDIETDDIARIISREGLPGRLVRRRFPAKWNEFRERFRKLRKRCFELEERDLTTDELVGTYHVWQLDQSKMRGGA